MIRYLSVLALIALLAVFAMPAAWAVGTVANGDFETGDVSGWTIYSIPDGIFSECTDPNIPNDCIAVIGCDSRGDQGTVCPHGGSYQARIHALTEPLEIDADLYIGGISQVVTGLNPASSYRISAWMRTRADYSPFANVWWGRLLFDASGEPLRTESAVPFGEAYLNSGWTKYEAIISGTDRVSLFAEVEVQWLLGNEANVFLDDLSIAPNLPALLIRNSNVTVHVTGSTTALIEWDTENVSGQPVAATSQVNYGLYCDYDLTVQDPTLVIHHAVTLTGLQNHEVYCFVVQSTAEGYTPAESLPAIFPSSGPRFGNADFQEGWHTPGADPGRVMNRWAWYVTSGGGMFWESSQDNAPDSGQAYPASDNPNDDMSQRFELATNAGEDPAARGIYQVMDTVAGTSYVLHGWARNLRVEADPITGFPVPSRLVIKWDFTGALLPDVPTGQTYVALDETAVNDPVHPQAGGEWQQFACRFTATGPTTTIFVEAQMEGGAPSADQYAVVIDDLAIGPLVEATENVTTNPIPWYMIGLPYEPLIVKDDPNDGTAIEQLFSGFIVENRLHRFDPTICSYHAYDPFDPKLFGPPITTRAMWWEVSESKALSYDGVEVTFPSRIVLSPEGCEWAMVGMPFPFRVAVTDLWVFNPHADPGDDPQQPGDFLPLADAVAIGWVGPLLYGYDHDLFSYFDVGLDGPPINVANWLDAWHGYWVQCFAPDCVLVVPPQPMPQ